ncbi:hypothetical protein J8631_09865 [Serratia fonticola]|uniref:DUF551 domain-containing protein n=1 Tax=Serratia fonticola TaxID=47917 RepID=UPI001AE16FC0|nr:DUF551 domain-containing protein [Serratia fonticola]MBP1035865.1 hypothetical protein [Serratia fonticola]
MIKELDDFTVERLQAFIDKPLDNGFTRDEQMLLARIALAAKTAEPVAYLTYKGYLIHAADPKLSEYSDPWPLYDAPPLNSPAIPDGWTKCSEELPPEGYEEDGGAVSYLVWHKQKPDCGPPYGISNVFFLRKHWEKHYTHWQPLPAPPTMEK